MSTVTKVPKRKNEPYLTGKRKILSYAVLIFLLALAVRVTFLAVRGPVLSPDSADYIRLAENIRSHGSFSLDLAPPFTPSIRRAPLYPFVLATLPTTDRLLPIWVARIQVLLDSGVAIMILILASFSLNLRWATGASLAYAVFPGAIYHSTTILTESLFTALLVGATLLFLRGLSNDRLLITGVGGVLLGFAALCRPIALLVPVIFIVVGLLAIPSRRWSHCVVLISLSALVVLPWTARTTRISNQLVLINGAAAVPFYIATRSDWNQKDQESLWRRFAEEDPYGRRLAAATNPREVTEADRLGVRLALQNIRANPMSYLKSRIKTIPYLFISSFDGFTGIHKSFQTLWQERDFPPLLLKAFFMMLFSVAPFLLGSIGLLVRRELPAIVVSTVWLYLLIANLPMWVEYRFWVPAVPFLLISATQGMQSVAKQITMARHAAAA